MKKLLALYLTMGWGILLIAQNYTSYFTGSLVNAVTEPLGGVCLMGGATEDNNAMRWFLQRANGGDVLVIRASGADGYNAYFYNDLGVAINSVETLVFNNVQAASDPYVLERINRAEAIWIAGGDQNNYVIFWRGTPLAAAINQRIANDQLVIGGTSAGMAILGGVYFSASNGTVTSAQALANPYDSRVTISNIPFLRVPFLAKVITDTHYDNPDRRGRQIAFLARATTDYGGKYFGLACDEYTAVCIDNNGLANVYGTYPDYDDNAYFITSNCGLANSSPEQCVGGQPLSWNHGGQALKVYTVKGTPTGIYSFDLSTWENGTGGEWQDWSVVAGSFAALAGEDPNCSPVATQSPRETVAFKVYPNPTNQGQISVEIGHPEGGQLQLLDQSGRVLRHWDKLKSADSLDLSNFPPGIYFLAYTTENSRQVRQVVIH